MPKFNVQVWRTHTVTETDFLTVEAATPEAAKVKALELAPSSNNDSCWEDDDPSNHCGTDYEYDASNPVLVQRSLRPCKWSFDDGPTYDGWTDDTYWNGFLNVCVTPETRDKVVADTRASGWCNDDEVADDIGGLPNLDGKIWLSDGWSISEVK